MAKTSTSGISKVDLVHGDINSQDLVRHRLT